MVENLDYFYHHYESDFNDTRATASGTSYGQVLTKLMFSISLTHARQINFWLLASGTDPDANNISRIDRRYEALKTLFINGKMKNDIFEQLEIEEMRYITRSTVNDEEIAWYNGYFQGTKKNIYNATSIIAYDNSGKSQSINYYKKDIYYGENRKAFETKYKLNQFKVSNVKYYPKSWMVLHAGGVCWHISNFGQNLLSSNGIPCMTVAQPAHRAYLAYTLEKDTDGSKRGVWTLWYDSSNWNGSNIKTGEYRSNHTTTSTRSMIGWGDVYFASHNNLSYIPLAQAAMDDYQDFVKSETYVKLADSYSDIDKKIELYEKALEILDVNYNAWIKLVEIYKSTDKFTDEQKAVFITRMSKALSDFPQPLHELSTLLINTITSDTYKDVANSSKITAWTSATNSKVSGAAYMGNYYLGKTQQYVRFSFDDNILGFAQPKNTLWEYSLDGGKTWRKVVEGYQVVLTPEELSKITVENGIDIHIIGLAYNTSSHIDVFPTDYAKPKFYANPLEQRFFPSITRAMEWRYENDTIWNANSVVPDFSLGKKVEVRYKAIGNKLPSESSIFEINKEIIGESPTKKYIPILTSDRQAPYKSAKASSEVKSPARFAAYAIAGDANAPWQSATNDKNRWITLELKEATYVSQLAYIRQYNSNPGSAIDVVVYASLDNKNWTTVGKATNLALDDTVKLIEFVEMDDKGNIILDEAGKPIPKSVYAKYVKFQATKTYNNGVVAGLVTLYKDVTAVSDDLKLDYSTAATTNKDVKLTISPLNGVELDAEKSKVTKNNDGTYTYIFEKNGTLDLYYTKGTEEQKVTVKVDWIDKMTPEEFRKIIKVTYDITTPTNGNVIAKVGCNTKRIKVTNNNHNANYLFTKNGTFDFDIEDEAGNTTTVTANVS